MNKHAKKIDRTDIFFCANQTHFEMSYKNVTAKAGRLDVLIPLCKKCYDLAFNVCPNCNEIHNDLSCAYISDDELKEKGYNPDELRFNEAFEDLDEFEIKKKAEQMRKDGLDFLKGVGFMIALLILLAFVKTFML